MACTIHKLHQKRKPLNQFNIIKNPPNETHSPHQNSHPWPPSSFHMPSLAPLSVRRRTPEKSGANNGGGGGGRRSRDRREDGSRAVQFEDSESEISPPFLLLRPTIQRISPSTGPSLLLIFLFVFVMMREKGNGEDEDRRERNWAFI
ncbi:hypothetical protein Csa_001260 [Cucumis sativus]|uniref:Uncharacterized protein n=1 Tax=Cucumis sativus TaxID=3659 RepID=A0A0A0LC09_CUCSA|nr:hypothetical protein Csa_001260 [Cucumis sativus]